MKISTNNMKLMANESEVQTPGWRFKYLKPRLNMGKWIIDTERIFNELSGVKLVAPGPGGVLPHSIWVFNSEVALRVPEYIM